MTTPIVLPILTALEINIVWFGVLVTINMCCGNISPPMGLNLYIVKGLMPDEINLRRLFVGAIPFIVIDMIMVALVMAFPALATWLPSIVVPN
jgi:TRAP-type mannitol/chloroaromatic compound transport system permease large subunit